jgi:hypothetical protein
MTTDRDTLTALQPVIAEAQTALTTAAAALTAQLATPVVIAPPPPPPPPPSGPVESADGTTISPGVGVITDGNKDPWTLAPFLNIQKNGINLANGWQSHECVYHDHKLHVLGLDGNWYAWDGTKMVPASNPLVAPGPVPVVAGPVLFVAPGGSDNAAGTLAAPLATLQAAANKALPQSTIFVRGGSYPMPGRLSLGSAHNGTTWQSYPPDGVNSAVLDGQHSVDVVIRSDGAKNLTIDGLKIVRPFAFAIELINGDSCTIQNCDCSGNVGTGPDFDGWPPLVSVSNITNAKVLHNYVHDCISMGIGAYAYGATDRLDGTLISGNVVLRAAQQTSDAGGIYINMHDSHEKAGSVTVDGNFVRDTGNINTWGIHDIYLDDTTCNTTVINNVCGSYPANAGQNGQPYPLNSMNLIFENSGTNNKIVNNIFDLGSSGTTNAVTFAGPAGQGNCNNSFSNNIVIGNFAGAQTGNSSGKQAQFVADPGGASNLSIHDNLYHNYGGGQERTDGLPVGDSSPVHKDPLLSGVTYVLDPASPAFTAIGFKDISRTWGPPGFVIPAGATSQP